MRVSDSELDETLEYVKEIIQKGFNLGDTIGFSHKKKHFTITRDE